MSDNQGSLAQSLNELVSNVKSTIPLAKEISYRGVNANMSLDVAQELVQKLATIGDLETDNERLTKALEYVLQSGAITSRDGVEKAMWALGLIMFMIGQRVRVCIDDSQANGVVIERIERDFESVVYSVQLDGSNETMIVNESQLREA